MKSSHASTRELAAALAASAQAVGESAPSVRGADWRLATVTAVGTGTVTADGIVVRCLEPYTLPLIGDIAVISQSSSGNWISFGRLQTTAAVWTNLTLAAGYINPGHGYTASYLRDGPRIHLRGRIGLTGGGGIPNVTPMATIPAAVRPAGAVTVGWAVARDTGKYPAVVRVEITETGVLRTFETAAPLPTWVALDGITYTI